MITIFTPTFNRLKLIKRLYKSLLAQTSTDFEWLVVDDGSTDDTEEFFKLLPQREFPIRYIKQANAGKHIAINTGVDNAHYDWFFIVDSDDYLLPNAVSELKEMVNQIESDQSFAGICTNRMYEDGSPNGRPVDYETLDTNFIDYALKYKYDGEKPSCIRTSVWKEFKFPVYPDEKFCSEALVLRRIGKKYRNRYFNKCVYVMEGYLSDGLTQSIKRHYENSPSYSCLVFKEQVCLSNLSIKSRISTYYNYWHYYFKVPVKRTELKPDMHLSVIGFPFFCACSIAKRILKK